MADKTPADLTAATMLTGAEILHVIQGANSRRTTVGEIADLKDWQLVDQNGQPSSGATWSHSTNVAAVNVTGLAGWNEVMVLLRLVTADTVGRRSIKVSTNDGVSYLSALGDYQAFNDEGAETAGSLISTHRTNATAARTSLTMFHNWNKSAPKIVRTMRGDFPGFLVPVAAALNALQILNEAGNLTGGSIFVFVR